MDCREAQSLIIPFIEGKLNDEQNMVFIDHVEHCSDCYDELEVYFIAISGIRQLDGDSADYIQGISDFKGALKNYIDYKKNTVNKHRSRHRKYRIIITTTAFLIAVITGAGYWTVTTNIPIGQKIKRVAASIVYKSSGEPIKKSVEKTLNYHYEEYSGDPELIINREIPKDKEDENEENSTD